METSPLIIKPKRKSLWDWFQCCVCPYFLRRRKLSSRIIKLGEIPNDKFSPNNIRNQKYSIVTFIPLVLFQQFKFFLNLYFLIMAFSQFIPEIQIGYIYTYWGPLCFVISITIFREAYDDFRRYTRDKSINSEKYDTLILNGENKGSQERVKASSLRVGDILLLRRGQRVPADLLLLRTTDRTGSIFIATDQLDGETDWKVRVAVPGSQKATRDSDILNMDVNIFAEPPQSDIHSFIGTWTNTTCEDCIGLQVQNTLWAGSVLESSHATGVVIYTGPETRSVMNNSLPRSKVGQFDLKVNDMIKVLFVAVIILSFLMVSLKGFHGPWIRYLCRFILLFSYIIPISVRVNLEIGKTFYAWKIKRDKEINGTVMRTTTIPEEMGRVSHLLADKTGTVTKNEMAFKKFSMMDSCYDERNFHEVETLLTQHITKEGSSLPMTPIEDFSSNMLMNDMQTFPLTGRQIWEAVLGMALCHNVTPVYDRDDEAPSSWNDDDTASSYVSESKGGSVPQQQLCDYQAASPDEVALVKWTDFMGVSLYQRDLTSISLKLRATNEIINYTILDMFPFTSETKCMGIIVKDNDTSEISYYLKGADSVLQSKVGSPNWLKTQCNSLANEGLRTLVFTKKRLSQQEYINFKEEYEVALASSHNRMERIDHCMSTLNNYLQLLSVTGVEDRLADDAVMTIDILRKAGIKIWMLTGDKLETALCISKSLHLIKETERDVFIFQNCSKRVDTHTELLRLQAEGHGVSLIIDGESFDSCLKWYCDEFSKLALECTAVIVARCSPTQKAQMVRLLKQYSTGSVCAVGDGGNDVPMIQEADIGIGLEGKEGRTAALASDVSTKEFRCLSRLLLIHGRRARLRSSTLSFFVIHRGLVISTMQAIFSTVFYFAAISIYQGFLMVGYGTVFTMLPVISLVLDKDISSKDALENPILYKGLVRQRMFSYKMFFMWVAISIYQGGVIMYGALIMFEDEFINIVSISFTALILTELLMIILIINTWHKCIILAEILSVAIYLFTTVLFPQYIDWNFIRTSNCILKVLVITVVSWIPLCLLKYIYIKISKRRRTIMKPDLT